MLLFAFFLSQDLKTSTHFQVYINGATDRYKIVTVKLSSVVINF